ncbi:MAG: lysyl oxidase family protein [Chloroflexota bacterium]|nr:lysyl oxidase family protein [Chloroflexota bacterium]
MSRGTTRHALRRVLVGCIMFVLVLAGQVGVAAAAAPGSIVKTSMWSQVGVVLDEIPKSMRARVAADIMTKPDSFWLERAHRQLKLTTYRLVFRDAFHAHGKALPLPPEPLWNIQFSGEPTRQKIDGHDVVAVNYHFTSILLSDAKSPGQSEPSLAQVGGRWREHFLLPVDPELVMQRTGYACMDEAEFPFGSVDSEEVDAFYDQTAVVEDALSREGYHQTVMPTESCVDAVTNHIGAVRTYVQYTRLTWDAALADQYRYGDDTGRTPDLQTFVPDFLPSRTVYRYVHSSGSGGCEVEEGSVTGTGWRRLLEFTTADENVGETALTIGGVDYTISGHPGQLEKHNLYVFSPCHGHLHFKYYANLRWTGHGKIFNTKKGFCLQSTFRPANRETSPLHNDFSSCDYQGIAPGWMDQYTAGLTGQWVDTTTLSPGTGFRKLQTNPNGFLCEGWFVDKQGNRLSPGEPVVWAKTGLIAENGKPVMAPLCDQKSNWDANNSYSVQETIKPYAQGLITEPCARGQIGPLRNCGFGVNPQTATCPPGAQSTLTLSIPANAQPQVVRLTEFSHVLHSAIPARFEDFWVPLTPGVSDQPVMLANVIVMPSAPRIVHFTCPSERTGGDYEPGGKIGIYSAPIYPEDARAAVTVGSVNP